MIIGVNFVNDFWAIRCFIILRFSLVVKYSVKKPKELTVEAASAASTVNSLKVIKGFFTVSYQSC